MFRPLLNWINRKISLPERFYKKDFIDIPKDEWSVWISIEEVAPLYLAKNMNWLGLKESRAITEKYLELASEIINCELKDCGLIDREEREWILDNIGAPPIPSLPLYLITISDENEEKLVYVGKTENKSRFSGGHSAALKLHNPKYNNKLKKIYRATIWFHDNNEYISLDWIKPEKLALDLLDSIESHLIYSFQPELNTAKMKKKYVKWDFYIHIQNFLEEGFLNDEFI